MKVKALLMASVLSVCLTSCGQLETPDEPVLQEKTASVTTTVTSASTSVSAASTAPTTLFYYNGEDGIYDNPIDEIEFETEEDFLAYIDANYEGDSYMYPEFDRSKYEIAYLCINKIPKMANMYLTDEDKNGVKIQWYFNGNNVESYDEFYRSYKCNEGLPFEIVEAPELRGFFEKYTTPPYEYFFAGYNSSGQQFNFIYQKNDNSFVSVDELKEIMGGFNLEFTKN